MAYGYFFGSDSLSSKRRMAERLLEQATSPQPIQHWAQGLAQMAQAALGGYELNRADKEDKAALALLMNAPGLAPAAPAQLAVQPAQPAAGEEPRPAPKPERVAAVTPASATARPGGPVMPSDKVWGDAEAEAAGLYEPTSKPAAPAPAPVAAAQPIAGPQIPPQIGAHIRQLLSNPRTAQAGMQLYGQYAKPSDYGFQTTPDGTILRTDSRSGTVAPIYQAPTKPTFTEIGIDPQTGQPVRGFVDAAKRTVQPYAPPTSGQPSTIPPVPAGVDPKVWREKYSQRSVEDALPADTKTVSALRKEVQDLPSYKNLAQAAPVYRSMADAAARDTRGADVNMIYAMAKIMDPGSVVRESEMTVAQAVATLPQQLRATVESQLTAGGRLTPDVRASLMQEAESRLNAYKLQFDQDAGMYRGIAQRGRMNELDVIPSFGEMPKYQPKPRATPNKAALKKQYGLE
jgi:hypothetical protein